MKSVFLIFAGIIFFSVAKAKNLNDTTALQELTVTAPIKTNVILTPLDVTVISEEEIDKSTESSLLPVLQSHIPGMFVSERGMEGYGVSGGAAGTVNIRGVGSGNKILFMIDGIPTWAGMFGHANPDTYVANGVEKVEVVKGPSSLFYGSGAMGGSVNIITKKKTQDGFSGRARAMLGSYYTYKLNLSGNYKKDKFSAIAAFQYNKSDNNRENANFWLFNEYLQLQYLLSKNWNVGANADMTQSKAHNPGSVQSPLENMWTKISRGTASLYAHNNYGNLHGGVQAYINWGRHKLDDGNSHDATPRNYLFNLTDYNLGFSIFETFSPWIDNNLSVGIDFQHWGGHIWNTPKPEIYNPAIDGDFNPSEARHNENDIAGYLMMQQGFIDNLISVNAGLRLQHNSIYGNVWVPQAGFIIRPASASEIKFNFSKGFRSPNIRELYLYNPANSNLKPEYLLNYELSYRQNLFDHRLNFGAAIYFIDGKDMIQTGMVNGRPLNMNTGKFKNKGFELDASWRFLPSCVLYGGYAYLHTDNKGLLYAPKNKFDISLTFTPSDFEFTLENNNIWSLNNGSPDGNVNYSLLNFRGSYTYDCGVPLTFVLKVDNIFGEKYEVVYGFPMPGTTVLVGAEIKF